MKTQTSLRETVLKWFKMLGAAASVSTWPYRAPSHAEIQDTMAALAHAKAAVRRPQRQAVAIEACCCAPLCC